MITSITVPVPDAHKVEITQSSYPFSTMRYAREPLDLAKFGYLEEEYFISGYANVYGFSKNPGTASDLEVVEGQVPYTTRILVRRPADSDSETAWVTVLNASQGYDIEDDWRRAWNYFISRRLTYVAVTAKPIQVSALQTFDPERYSDLSWGGNVEQLDANTSDWNPFMKLSANEEGLAWDILAQVSAWLRSCSAPIAPRNVFLIGQSQSSVYVNTYLTFFHNLLKLEGGRNTYDGYAPGVGSVYVKEINQRGTGVPEVIGGSSEILAPGSDEIQTAFVPYLVEPVQLDVPVVSTSSEADVQLYGGAPSEFNIGDGPMRRHWHVLRAPHSDARSRVIPDNSQVLLAKRRARVLDENLLASLSVMPLEPIITASMTAVEKWAIENKPAAASKYFNADGNAWITDKVGLKQGGIVVGIVANPIADFTPGAQTNPVYGLMALHSRDSVLERFATFDEYQAACDVVDDELEAAGYLEPVGRHFLHNVERELWNRIVNGAEPPLSSPQEVIGLRGSVDWM